MNGESERCKEEEYLAGWKRAKADLLNYKKSEGERMKRVVEVSVKEFVLDLLPVVDSLERASENISDELKKKEEVKGLLQIKDSLLSLLEKRSIDRVNVLGKEFDPRLAEAVEVVSIDAEDDKVVEVITNGYKMGDKIIRPAQVKVNKINSKSAETEEGEAEE